MSHSSWTKLAKPILALAPMANVTDAAFRRMFARYGKPDVMLTEFVSVDGLLSKGKDALLRDFWYAEAERPIVAQIFGAVPEHFEQVAAMICELGFDGIDINMGCPDKAIEKQGAGAALINNPKLAAEIIRATKRGAHGLPISVKTRIGYKQNQLADWLPALFAEELAAVTVHLRTRKEMSDVPAHWELANDVVALRDQHAPQTLVLGNGDVQSLVDGRIKCEQTGLDGVLIGRAAFGQPWFFHRPLSEPLLDDNSLYRQPQNVSLITDRHGIASSRERSDAAQSKLFSFEGRLRKRSQGQTPPLAERLRIMIEHTELFEELYGVNRHPEGELPSHPPGVGWEHGRQKPFATMKKHFKAYVNGFDGAKELRIALMATETAQQVRTITEAFMRAQGTVAK